MSAIPLRLGPLGPDALHVRRSGLRWLCSDGALCRANEIVAFCNLSIGRARGAFSEEGFDLQVALALPAAGRVWRTGAASSGGYLDRIPNLHWDADTVWARLEPSSAASAEQQPNLLFLAGRRIADSAEDRSGLLTGWHDRTRAWWGDGQGATLLAPGGCDQGGLIRGDDNAYSAMFELSPGPAQIVMSHDDVLVPCATVLRQQLQRTPEEAAAIRQDIASHFIADGAPPSPAGWLFAGSLLRGFERSYLDEGYDLLTRSGLTRAPPAAAVCLSLLGEGHYMLRHRRLGYVLNMYAYRLTGTGEAAHGWLRREFEPFFQSIDDIARDFRALVAAAPDRTFVFVNRICCHPNENIRSYDALDDETMVHTHGLRAQELNLMLHDLARAPNVAVLDADAIAGDMGIVEHLPDAVHATGALNQELRSELVRILRARHVVGF